MMSTPPETESDKRSAILQAACHCFSHSGFSACRIADIAQVAGVGKGTVYEYFRSKEDLLLDACLYDCGRLETIMDTLIPGLGVTQEAEAGSSQDLHPVSRGFLVLRSVLAVLLEHSQGLNRMASDLAFACQDRPDLMQRAQETMGGKWQGWILRAWELGMAGMDSGDYRSMSGEDYRWAARLVVAAVDGLVWQHQFISQPGDHATTAHHIAAAWIRLHLHDPADLDRYIAHLPDNLEPTV